jgi:Glycosyl transferase family 2
MDFAEPNSTCETLPFVSVIIDTYNYGRFVEQAIESALAQDFPVERREILVVDDGSTDDTRRRVKKYGDRIRYLLKPNGGQASAFNYGLAHARGEIIALLDADDAWERGKLRRVCEMFGEHAQAGMVYHRARIWDGETILGEDSHFVPISGWVTDHRKSLLHYPMVSTSNLAFRRAAIEPLLPIPENLRTQADAYLTALVIFVAPVVALPEFWTKYRQHGGNAFHAGKGRGSRAQIEQRMKMRATLLSDIQAWLNQHPNGVHRRDLEAYMKQWYKAQEADSYELQTPSRWRYFRHLAEFPRLYAEIMSPRHRAFSYARSFAALLLGYRQVHRVDQAHLVYKKLIARLKPAGTTQAQ